MNLPSSSRGRFSNFSIEKLLKQEEDKEGREEPRGDEYEEGTEIKQEKIELLGRPTDRGWIFKLITMFNLILGKIKIIYKSCFKSARNLLVCV